MALRVLLADESVTIKKVIQLALQDFAVEVKAVPVGIDVLEVSKSFQPDLVFADILLQKRSGYEVCADLKKDAATAAIPVVLMWSSFMELDQKQVETCGADGKLEKPFEVETLRKLVLQLVPRTRSQRLATFLDFPASIAAPLKGDAPAKATPSAKPPVAMPVAKPAPPPEAPISLGGDATPLGALPDLQLEGLSTPPPTSTPTSSGSSAWNMDSFEPLNLEGLHLTDLSPEIESEKDADDKFEPIQLSTPVPSAASLTPAPELTVDDDDDEPEAWSNKSLEKYRLPPLKPDESLGVDDSTPDFQTFEIKPPASPPAKPAIKPPESSATRTFMVPDSAEIIAPEAKMEFENALPSVGEATEIVPHIARPKRVDDDDDFAEFSMSDEEFDRTEKLEIEAIDQAEKTRPAIVRELLRDPDFSAGPETDKIEPTRTPFDQSATFKLKPEPSDSTINTGIRGAVDLSRAGKPSLGPLDSDALENVVRAQIEPALAKTIERVVAELLPEIAERIIKRELERLLEDSSS